MPANTKYLALSLWHLLLPYLDPAPEDVKKIRIDGYNDENKTGYNPMPSKGFDREEYNLTIYAPLSKPIFNTTKVQRSNLLKTIDGITIDERT